MEIKNQLFKQAYQASQSSYSPYSNYKVGASIYTSKGNIYSACNVENVSFPCGTCAEAGAISAMVSSGEQEIKALLVLAYGDTVVYPCGACLQRIAEFASPNTPIYLASPDGIKYEYLLKELFPFHFNNQELKHD